ncbi:hypothetical protein [Nocardia sp. NBC_01327]|uniref:hypothetical protein n=1 Tax=Nocardia sp. NBC_01327 TaxID=2903593 RepID=UPI002E153326|nr:hypothetical protein OG326_23030 [Nocardia sp. NBC_01327]
MRFPGSWLCVDVIATRLAAAEDIVIHSAGALRVAKRLRREDMALGFNKEGRVLFEQLVREALTAGPRADRQSRAGSIEFRTHWVLTPDEVPVGLVVWLGPGPIPPRPDYNSWIMDLEAVATSSAGDDLASIGDGRRVGEYRPIRDLLKFMNPDDVQAFLSLYYDARTGPKGTRAEAYWSVLPTGTDQFTHFWSSAIVPEAGALFVHGITVKLAHREYTPQSTRGMITGGGTLVIVDPGTRVPVTVWGKLTDLLADDGVVAELLGQLDIDKISADASALIEDTVTLAGAGRYHASAFLMPTSQKRPVHPLAIMLHAAGGTAA